MSSARDSDDGGAFMSTWRPPMSPLLTTTAKQLYCWCHAALQWRLAALATVAICRSRRRRRGRDRRARAHRRLIRLRSPRRRDRGPVAMAAASWVASVMTPGELYVYDRQMDGWTGEVGWLVEWSRFTATSVTFIAGTITDLVRPHDGTILVVRDSSNAQLNKLESSRTKALHLSAYRQLFSIILLFKTALEYFAIFIQGASEKKYHDENCELNEISCTSFTRFVYTYSTNVTKFWYPV